MITGDGEMLMGMGSLATVGLQKPANLTIVVLDNEVDGETGGRPATPHHGRPGRRRPGVRDIDARAIATMADVEAFAPIMQDVSSGPRFASVKIDSANLERVLSSRDGTFIVTRIRGALGFGRFERANFSRCTCSRKS